MPHGRLCKITLLIGHTLDHHETTFLVYRYFRCSYILLADICTNKMTAGQSGMPGRTSRWVESQSPDGEKTIQEACDELLTSMTQGN